MPRGGTDRRDLGNAVHERPLEVLGRLFPDAGDSAWLADHQLVVGDAAAARKVLANPDGRYQDHSDFFHTRRGLFGPRAAQERIARASRDLLRRHHRRHRDRLPELIRRHLVPRSLWPDAGNRLAFEYFEPTLAGPSSSAQLAPLLGEIVERAVLAGARERQAWLRRLLSRRRAARVLGREIEARRSRLPREPEDLVDVIVQGADSGTAADELAEILLSFLFAAAGSVGFVLAWSLHLLGRHPETDTEPAWVVREALRLWPVAWILSRQSAVAHEVAGASVAADDEVVVCPYALHRSERYWPEPHRFRPERWAEAPDYDAYLPFGWGPHRCAAAAVALQVVEDCLAEITDGHRMVYVSGGEEPTVAAALAPPPFVLELEPVAGGAP